MDGLFVADVPRQPFTQRLLTAAFAPLTLSGWAAITWIKEAVEISRA
jgi:hypothetical protein